MCREGPRRPGGSPGPATRGPLTGGLRPLPRRPRCRPVPLRPPGAGSPTPRRVRVSQKREERSGCIRGRVLGENSSAGLMGGAPGPWSRGYVYPPRARASSATGLRLPGSLGSTFRELKEERQCPGCNICRNEASHAAGGPGLWPCRRGGTAVLSASCGGAAPATRCSPGTMRRSGFYRIPFIFLCPSWSLTSRGPCEVEGGRHLQGSRSGALA